MKALKEKTIMKYSIDQLCRYLDRAMLRMQAPTYRIDLAFDTIYRFDESSGAFLFEMSIGEHNKEAIRDLVRSVGGAS